jgi:hypothetical protein
MVFIIPVLNSYFPSLPGTGNIAINRQNVVYRDRTGATALFRASTVENFDEGVDPFFRHPLPVPVVLVGIVVLHEKK